LTISAVDYETGLPLAPDLIRVYIVAHNESIQNITELYRSIDSSSEKVVKLVVPSDRRFIAQVEVFGYSTSSTGLYVKHKQGSYSM